MAAIALGSTAAVACTPPGGPTGPVDPEPSAPSGDDAIGLNQLQ